MVVVICILKITLVIFWRQLLSQLGWLGLSNVMCRAGRLNLIINGMEGISKGHAYRALLIAVLPHQIFFVVLLYWTGKAS